MPTLFPTGYTSELAGLTNTTETSHGYRPGVAFDEQIGDFLCDGNGVLLSADGLESTRQWIAHNVVTQRYSCLAYHSDFGIDLRAAFHAETRDMAELILSREITQALLADPYGRIVSVEDISFDWQIHGADAVEVQINVRGLYNLPIHTSVTLSTQRR